MDGFKNTTRMRPMAHDPKAVKAGDRQHGGPLRQTDAQIRDRIRKEEGEAVARGNRTPYEPIPPAPKRMKTGGMACAPMKTGGKAMKTGGLAAMPSKGKKC